jgi:hypothetical protein
MPEIGLVKTIMSGYAGAPGYSTHAFFGDPYSNSTAQDNVNDVAAFWNGCADRMAKGFTFNVQPDVHVVDEVTGVLQRIEVVTPDAQGIFAGSAAYAAGVGAVAQWSTAGVHLGQPLRGRTFIVPLAGDQYQDDGTIGSIGLGDLRTVAGTLAAVANFGVWGRPVAGAGGDWAAATGGTIRDHVAWLSSRRD